MLTHVVVGLNWAGNLAGNVLLAPIAWLPGSVSATLLGIASGIAMLFVFKHTSRQTAIRRVRNDINASLLGLSLFKESLAVGLKLQGRLLAAAVRLIALSIVPIAVMIVPTCLVLGQMAAWFQASPLPPGEEAVVTVHLTPEAMQQAGGITIELPPAVQSTVGPVRVPEKQFVCWAIQGAQPGQHELRFVLGEESFSKQVSVGTGLMPVSVKRPEWSWTEALLHPREAPFHADSPVQSIEVSYPPRRSWTHGTQTWLVYWFLVSMAAAFAARPLLGVDV